MWNAIRAWVGGVKRNCPPFSSPAQLAFISRESVRALSPSLTSFSLRQMPNAKPGTPSMFLLADDTM